MEYEPKVSDLARQWMSNLPNREEKQPEFILYLGEPRYTSISTRKFSTPRGNFIEVATVAAGLEVTRTFTNARLAKKFVKASWRKMKWVRYSGVVLKTSQTEPVEHADGFVDVSVDFSYTGKRVVSQPEYEPHSLVIHNA